MGGCTSSEGLLTIKVATTGFGIGGGAVWTVKGVAKDKGTHFDAGSIVAAICFVAE